MLDYAGARENFRTGDVLLVKRRGLVSILIRALTAESYNHVAMILRNSFGVFVVEVREGKGWQLMPASQWFEKNKKSVIKWGSAPIRQGDCITAAAMKERGAGYSYWSLITVWLSQVFNRKMPHNLVCSTFIQHCWEYCGYKMSDKAADPADFAEHLSNINTVVYK